MSAKLAYEARLQEEEAFRTMLANAPIEHHAALIEARRVRQEEQERYATEERRHRELCRAIRDSRPHGLGIFW